MASLSASTIICILVFICSTSTQLAEGQSLVSLNVPDASADEASGVATPMSKEECSASFEKFEGFYLQGVKEDSFVTFNGTSHDECMMKCCNFQRFKCESFSYFAILRVCYIMNVTERHEAAKLTKNSFWIHYHIPGPEDNTTLAPESTTPTESATVTTPLAPESTPETTTAAPKTATSTAADAVANAAKTTTKIPVTTTKLSTAVSVQARLTSAQSGVDRTSLGTGGEVDASAKPDDLSDTETTELAPGTTTGEMETTSVLPNVGSQAAFGHSTTTSHDSCLKTCKNDGVCEYYLSDKNEERRSNSPEVRCACKEGYEGEFCEKETLAGAKIPSYVIAVAVLGSIILLLFLTVLIIYVTYRTRTGKYRVRERRERWNKSARRTQSFNSILSRSQVGGSELSVPGSVNSSIARSTATSV